MLRTAKTRLVAVGFVLSALMGLLWNVFSLLLVQIHDDEGWSVSDLSLAFSLFVLSYTFVAPVVGTMIARHGSRAVAYGLLALLFTGLAAASQAGSPSIFYLAYGVLGGIGSHAFSSLLIFTVLLQRFRSRGTTAIAIADSGTGAGVLLGFPVMHVLLETYGWRAGLLLLAIAVLVLGLTLHSMVPPSRREPPKGERLTAPTLKGNRLFVCLMGSVFFGAVILQGYQSHQIALLEHLGTERASAVYVMSLLAGVMTIWRALSGAMVDRFGVRSVMLGCLASAILAGLCFVAFIATSSLPWLLSATIFFAIGLGAQGIIMTAFTRELASGPQFSRMYGMVRLTTGFGLTAGPALAGFAYDSNGDYNLALMLLLVAGTMHFSMYFIAQFRVPTI